LALSGTYVDRRPRCGVDLQGIGDAVFPECGCRILDFHRPPMSRWQYVLSRHLIGAIISAAVFGVLWIWHITTW